MSTINLLARNCTLFTTTKALEEDAYRESLQAPQPAHSTSSLVMLIQTPYNEED